MNENGGKGLFYGVIGVATLIVAIIGATFAWFTATAGADDATLVTTGTLKITYTDGNKVIATNLKPATAAQVGAAYANASCAHVGDNATIQGNETICSYYKFTVTNTGSLYANLTANLTEFAVAEALTSEQRSANGNTPITVDTERLFKYAYTETAPGAAATFTGLNLADGGAVTLTTPQLAPSASMTGYIVVWLDSTAGNSYQGIKASSNFTIDAAQTNVTP